VAILAVPLFDMLCVIVSRLVRRESPMRGDATSHLAHRLLARGWQPRAIVIFAAVLAAMTGAAAVLMKMLVGFGALHDGPKLLWLGVAAVLVFMLIVRRKPPAEAAR
jgi:hypothetical protein